MSTKRGKNYLIEQLYEMAESKDDNGLSVFDEQKMRKELESNKNFMRSNKHIFAEGEPKTSTCKMYEPCPICEKCRVKASHIYVRCQTCQIPICVHKYSDIRKMIRRENFIIRPKREEFKNAFIKLKENIKNES